jgi:hypothetical protein
MKMRHLVAAVAAALISIPVGAGAALAAPPPNDTPGGATVVTTLPSEFIQDTTEATTDKVDAVYNAMCEAPATNGSVWYRYTAPTDEVLTVDVSRSSFSAGIMVIQGDPMAGGELQWCAPGSVTLPITASTEYWVMAFSDTEGVVGGTLVIDLDKAPTAPTWDVTVDPVAYAHRDGSITVSGTYTCSEFPYEGWLDVEVTQQVGRLKIVGYSYAEGITCDDATHGWHVTAEGANGAFNGGKAVSVAVAGVCGVFDCYVSDPVTATLQVRRARV